jgi:hypothetical protein
MIATPQSNEKEYARAAGDTCAQLREYAYGIAPAPARGTLERFTNHPADIAVTTSFSLRTCFALFNLAARRTR